MLEFNKALASSCMKQATEELCSRRLKSKGETYELERVKPSTAVNVLEGAVK